MVRSVKYITININMALSKISNIQTKLKNKIKT
jgi:hypothetical protein